MIPTNRAGLKIFGGGPAIAAVRLLPTIRVLWIELPTPLQEHGNETFCLV
jgi:hypothetical protein